MKVFIFFELLKLLEIRKNRNLERVYMYMLEDLLIIYLVIFMIFKDLLFFIIFKYKWLYKVYLILMFLFVIFLMLFYDWWLRLFV